MNNIVKVFCTSSLLFLASCSTQEKTDLNLLDDIAPLHEDGTVNAIIEIPAGTIDKWELNKTTGELEWEVVDQKKRVVDYIGYPGNYGMIPRTLLSKDEGGDGDPIDVLVLGHPLERGTIARCKIIGILFLSDRGEQDDKLIAVSMDSQFSNVSSIDDLKRDYNGISEIISLWFTNYKGPDKIISSGYGDYASANHILNESIEAYKKDIAEKKDQ